MHRKSLAACLIAAPLLLATTTFAASAKKAGTDLGGSGEVILIVQVTLLLVIGRGLGELMQRAGQPAVIGQLLAGLILGPSLFGWLWPDAHAWIFPATTEQKNLIGGLSDVGVMMLLFLTGIETDLKLARQVGAPALAVAAAGVAVPFACGFALAQFLPASLVPDPHHRLVAALFLGTALSISSIKIVAMVVREMNFMRRNLGQMIVASAVIEDTVGWIIIALTLGIAGARKTTAPHLITTIAGTGLFLVLSYTIGRRAVFWLIRTVNDSFVGEYAVVTAMLIVMFVMALITQAIGVNTVLGAFVAGVLVGQSPMLSRHIDDQLRGLITAFMMPIFFGLSGLSADLTILRAPEIAFFTVLLVAIASIGKFGGAFCGGVASGLTMRQSLALGCAMNARGSTEVIVATIGLTMGALTQTLYSMIVTVAILTTMAMPPMLRWALARLPPDDEEQARLSKEEIDEKGFVSGFERLLIAADESENGKLATRIASFVAGHRGIPLTMLKVEQRSATATEKAGGVLEGVAMEASKQGHVSASEEKGDGRQQHVDIASRDEPKLDRDVVNREAGKGYDLLVLGLARMRAAKTGFTARVDAIAAGFPGPVVLAFAGRGAGLPQSIRVLVPVNGTEASRQGAEIAFALSPAKDTKITALYIAERVAAPRTSRSSQKTRARRDREKAVLNDAIALAARHGHAAIDTALRSDQTPADAIIEEAERMNANVIAFGASRRVGDALYLGETAEQVLQRWPRALILLGI